MTQWLIAIKYRKGDSIWRMADLGPFDTTDAVAQIIIANYAACQSGIAVWSVHELTDGKPVKWTPAIKWLDEQSGC